MNLPTFKSFADAGLALSVSTAVQPAIVSVFLRLSPRKVEEITYCCLNIDFLDSRVGIS
jgi:hypothetical protein